MTKALITAAAFAVLGQTCSASTVNFSSSIFSDSHATVTYSVDGVDFTFWAESAGTPERFYKNGGLSYGYSHMHALTIVASETIQLTRLNGKSTQLDPSGSVLPFTILIGDEIQVANLEFPAYTWGWLDISDEDIVIPANAVFGIDADFRSWNWQGSSILGAFDFEVYTPPPVPLPATALLLLGSLAGFGVLRQLGRRRSIG